MIFWIYVTIDRNIPIYISYGFFLAMSKQNLKDQTIALQYEELKNLRPEDIFKELKEKKKEKGEPKEGKEGKEGPGKGEKDE